jgi:predicted NUDIX family NTP pyrophosphohydrolase
MPGFHPDNGKEQLSQDSVPLRSEEKLNREKPVECSSAIGRERGGPDVSARRFEAGSSSGASRRTLLAPKGEMNADEDGGVAALREFMEETGVVLTGPLEPLGEIRQRGGKRVLAFAIEGDLDVRTTRSNTFEIEWPPNSGKMQTFPEVDRTEWFDLPVAHAKILEGQRPLLDRLAQRLGQPGLSPA